MENVAGEQDLQPRSQGLSSLPPLSVGGREERPWERGCKTLLSSNISHTKNLNFPKIQSVV